MDWIYYRSALINEAAGDIEMLERLSDLRAEEPILWALVSGLTSSVGIANRLAWPHDVVLDILREHKKEGNVMDYENPNGSPMVWEIIVPNWDEEREFMKTMRRRNRTAKRGNDE